MIHNFFSQLEKTSIETEKELYKKRTQELVEKLNKAKPEDFIRLQQEAIEKQKQLQNKDSEITKFKNQLSLLERNQKAIVAQKNNVSLIPAGCNSYDHICV